MSGYSEFERRVAALREDIYREIFQRYSDRIRIKKEGCAVARLGTVFDKTLEIGNRTGFQAMSVRDLSEATGISMGALYSYIESKETLLDMILALGRIAAERVLGDVPAEFRGAGERLRWLLRTHLYLSEAMLPWFSFSYMESRHFGKEGREKAIDNELRSEQIIIGFLRQGVDEGEYTVADFELTAAVIKPLLQDWYLKRWKYRRRGVSVDAYADFVIGFIEAALRPSTPAAAEQA